MTLTTLIEKTFPDLKITNPRTGFEKELSYSFILGDNRKVEFYLHLSLKGVSVYPELLSGHPIVVVIADELKTIMRKMEKYQPCQGIKNLITFSNNLLRESERESVASDHAKRLDIATNRLKTVTASLDEANIHIAQLENLLFLGGETL